ncbi:MAG: hypothetical protein J0H96_11960 [Microbacterium ginsengisoli]|nr:hypothetical protein [Microbacterium ginsengisoli]
MPTRTTGPRHAAGPRPAYTFWLSYWPPTIAAVLVLAAVLAIAIFA